MCTSWCHCLKGTMDDELFAGRFALGGLVRRDGLGEVLRGVDADGSGVWVRLLSPGPSSADGLQAALEAMPRVTARHLARVVATGVEPHAGPGRATGPVGYIVWAVAESALDLGSVLVQGPLPPQTAARVAADLCWGLAAAHAAGLVHGILSAQDVVVVEGLRGSRLVGSGLYPVVRAGLGTAPPRSAPEVRAGAAPTPASDLWSVGALLQECLGEGTDRGRLPSAMSAQLDALLDPDPQRRPASARVVATQLVGLATGLLRQGSPVAPVAPVAPEAVRLVPAVVADLEPALVVPRPPAPPVPLPMDLDPLTFAALREAPAAPLPMQDGPLEPLPWDDDWVEPVADRPGPWRRRLLIGGVLLSLAAAATAAALALGGSDGPRGSLSLAPANAASTPQTPGSPTGSPTASGTASATAAAVPAPIVAPEPSTDAASLARVTRISVTAGDVGPTALRAKVPQATDWNAFVRALYASCDYYTPVGSPRLAHRIVRYDLADGTEVYNDVTNYQVPAQSVIDGLRTSLQRCSDLNVTEGTTVVGKFTVRTPGTPIPGLKANAVELEYLSVEPVAPPVRLVAFARDSLLDVVIVRGSSTQAILPTAAKVARAANGRLAAVG
jgi:hypothetical protein